MAEFNRCKIERLDTRSPKEKLKDLAAENETEKRLKEVIKSMQSKKRERSRESKRLTRELKAACVEI